MKNLFAILVMGAALALAQQPAASPNAGGGGGSAGLTGHTISAPLACAAASGSTTAYTCTTSPTFVPAAKDVINFCPDLANTGAATLVVNSQSGTPGIKKQQGLAPIVSGDLQASPACVFLEFDGTNWDFQGPRGNFAGVIASNFRAEISRE